MTGFYFYTRSHNLGRSSTLPQQPQSLTRTPQNHGYRHQQRRRWMINVILRRPMKLSAKKCRPVPVSVLHYLRITELSTTDSDRQPQSPWPGQQLIASTTLSESPFQFTLLLPFCLVDLRVTIKIMKISIAFGTFF